MLNRRSDKLELLRIAEAVALEKSIDKELIIDSMESGIAKAAKSKFGSENEIKVLINRDNGDIGIFRKLIIVDKILEGDEPTLIGHLVLLQNDSKGEAFLLFHISIDGQVHSEITIENKNLERIIRAAIGVVPFTINNIHMGKGIGAFLSRCSALFS